MTVRKKIIDMLKKNAMTLREISQAVKISEKEVATHLPHIQISIKTEGLRLIIDACTCLSCGFVFKNRHRFSRPGHCPICRSERINDMVFSVR